MAKRKRKQLADAGETTRSPISSAAAAELADHLFHKALQARSSTVVKKTLQSALKHDPEHVLSLTALALMEPSPKNAEEKLRTAVAIGERKLGELKTTEHGRLWGSLPARPYLEARGRMAWFLSCQEGRMDDAIAEHQELLRLDENDPLNMRTPLLGLLLEERRFAEARGLLMKYEGKGETSAAWIYGKALLEFQKQAEAATWAGPEHDEAWLMQQVKRMNHGQAPVIPATVGKADKALIEALEHNAWCAIHLMGSDEIFDEPMPRSFNPGSQQEARSFMEHQASAWQTNYPALLWLMVTAMPWLVANGYERELEP